MNLKGEYKAFALAWILTITTLIAGSPSANAHTPPWSIKTIAYLDVGPNPIGVNQAVFVVMWLHMAPPTAAGPYGDRWKGFTVEVTKPDGSKETLGPFSSDPVGIAVTKYVPNQVGTYYFQFSFPGQVLAGENLHPTEPTGKEYIGDYFEPSKSPVVSLTVQQEPLPYYPAHPLPTDYWTRPINAQHWSWSEISGNFLNPADWKYRSVDRGDLIWARYSRAPESAHILWRKPMYFGGLVGGEYGAHSFQEGDAYEARWSPPVIIGGRLFINTMYEAEFPFPAPDVHQRGFACIDLRTGEEIWRKNGSRIHFGQIYQYDTPNQHGAFAWLWEVIGAVPPYTWRAYDAWTGEWWFTIENVPMGFLTRDSDGSILVYTLGPGGRWLTQWNNTAMPDMLGDPKLMVLPFYGTLEWCLRPYGKKIDGKKGYDLNVSMPAEVIASINESVSAGHPGASIVDVKPGDRLLGVTGVGLHPGYRFLPTEKFTAWCLSLKPGEEGKLLWIKTYSVQKPYVIRRIPPACVSWEDGVFTVFSEQALKHWGYSLENGELLWETKPENPWQMFFYDSQGIAYGKLFSTGYSGILYCYNVETGELEWTFEAKDPYYGETFWCGRYPLFFVGVADKKIYVAHGEHSPNDPFERGSKLYCVDVDTGTLLWEIPFYRPRWAGLPAIADGILVIYNSYDNSIYAFGKGQTATTVSVTPSVTAKGNSVLIEGRVTDQSPGAKGTPAIADEFMSEWMKYLYMQYPAPEDIKGVDVQLRARRSDGTIMDIATVTSDGQGCFSYMWTPPDEDTYTIIAVFAGSKSYWASYAQTALGVTAAPPEAATAEQAGTLQSIIEAQQPLITALIVLVVIAIVISAYSIYDHRKLQK